LPVRLLFYLSIHSYTPPSVRLTVLPSVHLCICASVFMPNSLSIWSLSVCSSIHLFIHLLLFCLSVHLSIYLSACSSDFLSVSRCVWLPTSLPASQPACLPVCLPQTANFIQTELTQKCPNVISNIIMLVCIFSHQNRTRRIRHQCRKIFYMIGSGTVE